MKIEEILKNIDNKRRSMPRYRNLYNWDTAKRLKLVADARDQIHKKYNLPFGVSVAFEFNKERTKITGVFLTEDELNTPYRGESKINRYEIDDIDLVEYGLAEYA